ncbi:hypothetical protein [Streptomyces sp. NPDC006610]|uniref:hypothetical protein n=1 Tax=Streptomyces sp. NPDC006610 TaxID=3154584 RepID=UPI0033A65ED7
MSHHRIPRHRAAITVGGVAALGAAALLPPSAGASQDGARDTAAPRTRAAPARPA